MAVQVSLLAGLCLLFAVTTFASPAPFLSFFSGQSNTENKDLSKQQDPVKHQYDKNPNGIAPDEKHEDHEKQQSWGEKVKEKLESVASNVLDKAAKTASEVGGTLEGWKEKLDKNRSDDHDKKNYGDDVTHHENHQHENHPKEDGTQGKDEGNNNGNIGKETQWKHPTIDEYSNDKGKEGYIPRFNHDDDDNENYGQANEKKPQEQGTEGKDQENHNTYVDSKNNGNNNKETQCGHPTEDKGNEEVPDHGKKVLNKVIEKFKTMGNYFKQLVK